MAFITFVPHIILAASGVGSAVLLFAALGGFTGLAALVTVYVNYKRDKQTAKTEDKSVAITELEKAVPGLGDIIEQWQAVVHQLQSDLTDCRKRVAELEGEQHNG
jgi:hypothetical protein